jgi:hypothetical protein
LAAQHGRITKESVRRLQGRLFLRHVDIASDIAKIRIRFVEQDRDGIWSETSVPAFSPVLKKPNKWQNRIKFFEQWVISKLLNGNAYILKERDNRGVVDRDVRSGSDQGQAVSWRRTVTSTTKSARTTFPASKQEAHRRSQPQRSSTIRMVALYHPLCVGCSPPLTASASRRGNARPYDSGELSSFFPVTTRRPGGILTAPGCDR